MTNIISTFYLNIVRIVKEVEKNAEKKENTSDIIKYVKKELQRYNNKEWEQQEDNQESLQTSYMNCSWYINTGEEHLILFLIISLYKNNIHAYDSNTIGLIAKALAWAKVNPVYYRFYLDLLLNPEFYEELKRIEEFNKQFVISNITISINPDNDFVTEFHGIMKIIYRINNKKYSPFFHEDYSPKNVYDLISNIMKNHNEKSLIFTQKDFKTAEILLFLERNLQGQKKEEFKAKIAEIEALHSAKEIQLIREIIQILPDYFQKSIYLVRTSKNRPFE